MDIPANAFTVTQRIRFGHSDPAGIVYFPEFFRMFNDLFEDWMVTGLGIDFAAQFRDHRRLFPLVHVNADFKEARMMGQRLDLTLILTGLGRSTIRYTIVGHDGGSEILRADCVTCLASQDTRKSIPLPDDMRARMQDYQERCSI